MKAELKQQLLHTLAPFKRRTVARVAAKDDAPGRALFALAQGGKLEWSLAEAEQLCKALDSEPRTVGEWVDTLWIEHA